jgi:hypothetical protein
MIKRFERFLFFRSSSYDNLSEENYHFRSSEIFVIGWGKEGCSIITT